MIDLNSRVIEACRLVERNSHPFTPSHSAYVLALAPLVDEILSLPFPDIVSTFKGKVRNGTWDIHVLTEVKSALDFGSKGLGK